MREKKTRKKYSNESSPYNEWRDKRGDWNQEHEAKEPVQANPDVLPESAGLWSALNSNFTEDHLDLVLKEWHNLTKKQQDVLLLVGYQGRTLENASIQLGISKSSVQTIIERLRKKFTRLMSYKTLEKGNK